MIDFVLDLVAKRGMDQAEFAEAIGVSGQAVTNWKTRDIPAYQHQKVADFLGLTVDELLKQARSDKRSGPPWRVPVISYVRAGNWDEAHDPNHVGESDGYAYAAHDPGAYGYALKIRDDSMTAPTGKSFPEGCTVIVNPELRTPTDRQFVIAKLKGHNAVTFKQYRRDDIGRVWLQPLNPSHEPIREEFAVLGTVFQKVEDV